MVKVNYSRKLYQLILSEVPLDNCQEGEKSSGL